MTNVRATLMLPTSSFFDPREQLENYPMNRVINHIAVHVPNVDSAVEFYTTIFGFRKLKSLPRCTSRSEDPDAPVFRVYDERLQKVKVAFLTTGNSVGFELFQFIDPPMSMPANFDYTRGGVFHVAVTDNNPEEVCRKVIAAGGRKIGSTVIPASAAKDGHPECTLYCADPWGNTIGQFGVLNFPSGLPVFHVKSI